MAKKLIAVLCALVLLFGAGQAAVLLCQPEEEVTQGAEKPTLNTLIGTGIWWGKSETLERNVTQLETGEEEEKI